VVAVVGVGDDDDLDDAGWVGREDGVLAWMGGRPPLEVPATVAMSSSLLEIVAPHARVNQTTIDRGIRDTSRQICFEFLFIKTRPPHILDIGFRRGIE
jgi:hypothetical protein